MCDLLCKSLAPNLPPPVEKVLTACELAPDRLCQAVQVVVGQGTYRRRYAKEIMHRSVACKMCFQRAEAMAESAGAAETTCLHLLAAILEQPEALLPRV